MMSGKRVLPTSWRFELIARLSSAMGCAAFTLLVVAGCTSAKPPTCPATCPSGTACDGERCIPTCVPPCGLDESCGSDNLCDEHTADASSIADVDHGARADSIFGDGGVPGDTLSVPDADPVKQLCECVSQQPKMDYCYYDPRTCQVASDCCDPYGPASCGTYGNKWSCHAGECQSLGCDVDAECQSWARYQNQSDAADWICRPATCPGEHRICGPTIKICVHDSDCCDADTSVPCGIYTNHWRCDGGACRYVGCTDDPECGIYAQYTPFPSALVCRKDACHDFGHCRKPCSVPSDCCITNTPVPCGVFSNRYRCENNGCVLDTCTSKQDCVDYANALSHPGAADFECKTW
jgi:hypothetical protein